MLVIGEGEVRLGDERLVVIEPARSKEIAIIAIVVVPLGDGRGEVSVEDEVISAFFDPDPEPVPPSQKGFVSDLDRRCPRGRIPIERQQSMRSLVVENLFECLSLDADGGKLRGRDAPPGISRVLIHHDEPQEYLSNRFLPCLVASGVEILGPPSKRPQHTAAPSIGLTRQHIAAAANHQLSEGILHERQPTRLICHVCGDHFKDLLGIRVEHKLVTCQGGTCPLVSTKSIHLLAHWWMS